MLELQRKHEIRYKNHVWSGPQANREFSLGSVRSNNSRREVSNFRITPPLDLNNPTTEARDRTQGSLQVSLKTHQEDLMGYHQ